MYVIFTYVCMLVIYVCMCLCMYVCMLFYMYTHVLFFLSFRMYNLFEIITENELKIKLYMTRKMISRCFENTQALKVANIIYISTI